MEPRLEIRLRRIVLLRVERHPRMAGDGVVLAEIIVPVHSAVDLVTYGELQLIAGRHCGRQTDYEREPIGLAVTRIVHVAGSHLVNIQFELA